MTAAMELMPNVGCKAALEAVGLSRATFYRQRRQRPPKPRPTPARALSEAERTSIVQAMDSDRFVDRSPSEAVHTLAQEGTYLASERTFYRVLAQHDQVRERRAQRRHPVYAMPQLLATARNQVWSWDITKLMMIEKLRYLFLYVIMDIYSRYVVGWMVAEHENAGSARTLIGETCQRQNAQPHVLTLHSDRGSPMRSKTLAQLMAGLDVNMSFSRPQVSNDNPFSESLFKTAKYHPGFPQRFTGLPDAEQACARFFQWYNDHHHHSGIEHLTPAQVHMGLAVLAQRHQTNMAAFSQHPERFVHGPPRLRTLPPAVYINPPDTKEVTPPAPPSTTST
jgi:putative transposase